MSDSTDGDHFPSASKPPLGTSSTQIEEDAMGAISTNRARGKNIERRPAIGARTNGHV